MEIELHYRKLVVYLGKYVSVFYSNLFKLASVNFQKYLRLLD